MVNLFVRYFDLLLNERNGGMMLATGIFLFGLFWLIIIMFGYIRISNLSKCTYSTGAKLIDWNSWSDTNGGANDRSAYLLYEYFVDGKGYKKKFYISGDGLCEPSTTTVWYDPRKPKRCYVESLGKETFSVSYIIIAFLFGLMPIGVSFMIALTILS